MFYYPDKDKEEVKKTFLKGCINASKIKGESRRYAIAFGLIKKMIHYKEIGSLLTLQSKIEKGIKNDR